MRLTLTVALLAILVTWACISKTEQSVLKTPVPINAEEDLCQLCWMPIPDNAFACEAIHNGKVLKFDAVECLVGYLRIARLADSSGVEAFVRDADTKAWLKAREACFFRGDINSPMGAGIAAFADSASAAVLLKDFKGTIIRWGKVKKIPWQDILGTPQWKRRAQDSQYAAYQDTTTFPAGPTR